MTESTMNGRDLQNSLLCLGWSFRMLSTLTGYDERHVRRWAADEVPVPVDVAAWLLRRRDALINDPPPQRAPRRRPKPRPGLQWTPAAEQQVAP